MDTALFRTLRENMVRNQVEARGVHSPLVLDALRRVPREAFLPDELREFAYEDSALPIAAQQTILQPYTVGLMIEVLDLRGGEKVLEIGTGSGYGASVLGQIAREVDTVERIPELARKAAETIHELGYKNIRVYEGDGSSGRPENAPYDAIIVAAGGPEVPEPLKSQLKIGGRLVIPVGADRHAQELLLITHVSAGKYTSQDIADVHFEPLIGTQGWDSSETRPAPRRARRTSETELIASISKHAEPFDSLRTAVLDNLMARIGDARIVLLGEASHGTAEFYRMRDRISRALIEWKGFNIVAVEADWPDAARVDHYVRHVEYPPSEWTAFARFPTWMWRNEEVRSFVDWLRVHNADLPNKERTAFHGLDLYSLNNSITAVLNYLESVDPDTANVARARYGCLTPWQSDPATYGHAALTETFKTCEQDVLRMLSDLLHKQQAYALHDGERFLDAVQNARLVADAEKYYRIMYYGSRASWNLRDRHMFETLETLLDFRGPDSKAIIWAHNSHIGDASATEMGLRGEFNIGQLCRERFGRQAYAIGFGTNTGTVAAASNWDETMQVMNVNPAMDGSYELLCHETGLASFLLNLGPRQAMEIREGLTRKRLERAIGVIYRPKTEYASHYFEAELPKQFDEYVWFDRSSAVTPFSTHAIKGFPDTYPFGL